jgi:excisionase family DNA binding protein
VKPQLNNVKTALNNYERTHERRATEPQMTENAFLQSGSSPPAIPFQPPALDLAHRTIPTAEWLTAEEAAAYLKIKKRTLLRLVRQGKVPAYRLSGSKRRVWRFLPSDLDNALLANRVNSLSPAVLSEGRSM